MMCMIWYVLAILFGQLEPILVPEWPVYLYKWALPNLIYTQEETQNAATKLFQQCDLISVLVERRRRKKITTTCRESCATFASLSLEIGTSIKLAKKV